VAYRLPPPPLNPLARVLAGLLAALALAAAFFFGLVVLALAVGLGLLAWLVMTLRVWWLRRQGEVGADGGSGAQAEVRRGEVIEADYEVVSRRDDP
jgi:uncharacterized iron-regulated membrane protein